MRAWNRACACASNGRPRPVFCCGPWAPCTKPSSVSTGPGFVLVDALAVEPDRAQVGASVDVNRPRLLRLQGGHADVRLAGADQLVQRQSITAFAFLVEPPVRLRVLLRQGVALPGI